jgi:hypothetical protein
MPSRATPDSRYKRLQRFFSGFELDYHNWGLGIMNLMNIPQPWTLALDRTNWKFGYTDHNILMLAVVHEGVAIPLLGVDVRQTRQLQYRGKNSVDGRLSIPIS